jgi:chromosome segregation ATPase
MIRNLVLLGEQDDVSTHLRKLRPVAEALDLARIIAALDNGEYKAALEHIDAYLRRATALVVAGYADIARLRFQLEILELRLESLSDEKADLERSLITFNRRHDDALGNLIQRILKARAQLAQLLVADRKNDKEREEAEATASEAKETYNDYARQHEELQRAEPLPRLDEDAEQELKSLYRKACSLCHPDKVTEDRKEAAHSAFVELQEAYKGNDLARVREIHVALKSGGLPGTRSTTLSEVEALSAAIAELEYAIARMIVELKALQASDGIRLVNAAGATEADWQSFLKQQYETLEIELARIVSEIIAAQTDECDSHE